MGKRRLEDECKEARGQGGFCCNDATGKIVCLACLYLNFNLKYIPEIGLNCVVYLYKCFYIT